VFAIDWQVMAAASPLAGSPASGINVINARTAIAESIREPISYRMRREAWSVEAGVA